LGKTVKARGLLPVEIAFYLFLGIPLFYALPFIVLFFAFAQADLEFGVAFFIEKDAQRDDGIALLFDLVLQLSQLPFGKQKFAIMDREMVIGGPKPVFSDVHIPHPEFALKKNAEAVDEIDLAVTDRFHFRANQNHPRIEFIFDEIIVIGRSVLYLGAAHGFNCPTALTAAIL
jgi:hypothetical protein